MRKSSALVVVVVAALALAAACGGARSDDAIANEVKAKFFSDAQLKSANLDITVKDGQVTLSGEVPSDAARYAAYKLAADTKGVKQVDDRMTVQQAELTPPAPAEPAPARPAGGPVRKARPRRAAHVASDEPTLPPPPPSPAPVPAQIAPAQPASPPAPEPPQPIRVEIPAGTSVVIRMIDSIDSQVNHAGEIFRASLDSPITVAGDVVVPAGSDAFVKLVQAQSAGRLAGRSELRLELERIAFQGKSYVVESTTYEQTGASRGKRTAATVGGGAAVGAIIGAIAGGGKGAAIGATVGGGSGAAIQVLTKGQQVRVPSETRLDFRLEQPVEVSYFPEKNQSSRTRH